MSTLPPCPKCQSEFTYEDGPMLVCPECAHEWAAGDFLVWDNRCAMHRREVVNPTLPRVMWRSQFAGDEVIPG